MCMLVCGLWRPRRRNRCWLTLHNTSILQVVVNIGDGKITLQSSAPSGSMQDTSEAPSGSRRHRQLPFSADATAIMVVDAADLEQSEHTLSRSL